VDVAHLISMANSIGDFFAAYPDRAEASDEVARHIARFWEPRMRRTILAALDTPAVETMQPLVAEALRSHREQLQPRS
jgi:formate dehydrogenase subunit delta